VLHLNGRARKERVDEGHKGSLFPIAILHEGYVLVVVRSEHDLYTYFMYQIDSSTIIVIWVVRPITFVKLI